MYTYRTLGPRRFGCHGGGTPCTRIRFGCKNIKCVTLQTGHCTVEWLLPLAKLSRTQKLTSDGLKQPFFALNFFFSYTLRVLVYVSFLDDLLFYDYFVGLLLLSVSPPLWFHLSFLLFYLIIVSIWHRSGGVSKEKHTHTRTRVYDTPLRRNNKSA